MGRCMGRWEGRGSDVVVYGAMGRAREGWGGVWDDGKGAGGMGRCMGRWEGRIRDGEVYGAIESAHEA